MTVTVQLVKAFTSDNSQGNPAGIVHDADNLKDTQMLAIAKHYGFSECAYVQSSREADFRVRFFSPTQEIGFCGHATVATFFSLIQAGRINIRNKQTMTVNQETGIGILPVNCYSDGKIMMTQKDIEFGEIIEDRQEVAKLLGISTGQLCNLPIQVASTGSNHLIVPVADIGCLISIVPNLDVIVRHGKEHGYSGIAVLSVESFSGSADLATRNFSPSVGINEDPATGIAAGPLSCYADRYIFDGAKKQLVIEQGFDMGKASTIYTDINDNVLVGGYAALFGEEQFSF